MIVALAALISILLVGGDIERVFYVDDLDKLAKKYIIDDERKKEVLSEFRITKKNIKAFNKVNNKEFKNFKSKLENPSMTNSELVLFTDSMNLVTQNFQNQFADDRIRILAKITDEEWSLIVEESKKNTEKRVSKKGVKNQEEFRKTKKYIDKHSVSSELKKSVSLLLDNLISDLKRLEIENFTINSLDNAILANKNSTKNELLEVFNNVAIVRLQVTAKLYEFRKLVIEACDEKESEGVLTAFVSELKK